LGLIGRFIAYLSLKGRFLKVLNHNFLLVKLGSIFLVVPLIGFYAYVLVGEPLSLRYLTNLLLKKPLNLLDVGAGVGTYSILVAKLGGTAVAVEPNPLFASLIKVNARLNGVEVRVYQCYASDHLGPRMCPLDSLGVEADVIKIDVDGAELSVLRGGIETLRRARYVLIELRDETYYEAHRLLKQLGFRPLFVEPLWSSGLVNKLFLKYAVMPRDFNVLYGR